MNKSKTGNLSKINRLYKRRYLSCDIYYSSARYYHKGKLGKGYMGSHCYFL